MTYSIVARDEATGEMGAAVQSHWFSVGGSGAWAEAGVGAVVTQAWAEVSFGPLGLDLLRAGRTPQQALDALVASDEGCDLRQVGLVDAQGRAAAYTGKRCLREAGHQVGAGFSVQANMMLTPAVWPAMAEAFQKSQGDLAERLLCSLEAAQAAGGDIRGQQSACLKVVGGKRMGGSWEGMLFDLRVEDHPEPLVELRRLVQVQRGYTLMDQGDALIAKGDREGGLAAYKKAVELVPGNPEVPFSYAVALAEQGRVDEARPIFEQAVRADPNYVELYARITAAGLAKENAELLEHLRRLTANG
jgi:uncharacterized Ntn-hydrolase superfamily protein